MKINIGSANPNKVDAVKEVWQEHKLAEAEFKSVAVASEVPAQPITVEHTMQGAINRAKNAFKDCDISIGMESGLVPTPKTRTGYMGILCCVIHTGKENDFYFGQSTGFEYPAEVIKRVMEKRIELDTAFKELGFTNNPRIGYSNGIIGFLTQDRITRKHLAKEAIRMALVSFLNKELYKKL